MRDRRRAAVRLVTCAASAASDPETPSLAEALRRRGVAAEIVAWDDARVDWSAGAAAVLRSTWDYPGRLDAFLAWVDATARVTRVWNPPAAVRWSAHKRYLLALDAAAVPVVPTALCARDTRVRLDALLDVRGWTEAVVKPAVSLGAQGAARARRGEATAQRHLDALLAEGDVLVQPYARGIEEEGELSLVFVDGALSHAVRKRSAPGEWRVHAHHGGSARAVVAPAKAAEVAERALAAARGATGADLLYARVDLVDLGSGPAVMELELIEPLLFLADAPGAADRFARRLAQAAEGGAQ